MATLSVFDSILPACDCKNHCPEIANVQIDSARIIRDNGVYGRMFCSACRVRQNPATAAVTNLQERLKLFVLIKYGIDSSGGMIETALKQFMQRHNQNSRTSVYFSSKSAPGMSTKQLALLDQLH